MLPGLYLLAQFWTVQPSEERAVREDGTRTAEILYDFCIKHTGHPTCALALNLEWQHALDTVVSDHPIPQQSSWTLFQLNEADKLVLFEEAYQSAPRVMHNLKPRALLIGTFRTREFCDGLR